jgi:hypothetical protein
MYCFEGGIVIKDNDKITPKDWDVLLFFIEKESEQLRQNSHFSTYPGQIELEMKNITRPTIGEACKKFEKMGILAVEVKYPVHVKGGKTDFYSLKSDLLSIRTLVKLFKNKCSFDEFLLLLSKQFFLTNINENLVKEVLAEKKVCISRNINIIGWKEHEAQQLCNICLKNQKGQDNNNDKTTFYDYVKETVNKLNSDHNRSEKSYLDGLSSHFSQYFNDLDDTSIDVTKRYFWNDYLLFMMLGGKRNDLWYWDVFDLYAGRPFTFNFILPVVKDDDIEKVSRSIFDSSSYQFKKNYGDFYGYGYELIKNNFSAFKEHYEIFQFNTMILPILVLIWCSPSALYEFLCGDWESYTLFIQHGTSNQKELISKLLHIAIIDIISQLDIPKNTIIENVSSTLMPPSRTNITSDFCVQPDMSRRYEELFYHINQRHWNSISYSGINRLNNPTLNVRMRHLYEVSFGIGFVIESMMNANNYASALVSIDIRSDIAFKFFTVEDIKNPQGLISKLQQKNPLYDHIRNRLTNKIQNIILYYNVEEKPSVYLQQIIINDLNIAIMSSDFYDEKAFNSLKCKHKKVEEVMDNLSNNKMSKNQMIMNIRYRDQHNDSVIIENNRYLLEKAFENELSQEYTALFERLNY